jgi:hypothetical protein
MDLSYRTVMKFLGQAVEDFNVVPDNSPASSVHTQPGPRAQIANHIITLSTYKALCAFVPVLTPCLCFSSSAARNGLIHFSFRNAISNVNISDICHP